MDSYRTIKEQLTICWPRTRKQLTLACMRRLPCRDDAAVKILPMWGGSAETRVVGSTPLLSSSSTSTHLKLSWVIRFPNLHFISFLQFHFLSLSLSWASEFKNWAINQSLSLIFNWFLSVCLYHHEPIYYSNKIRGYQNWWTAAVAGQNSFTSSYTLRVCFFGKLIKLSIF